MESLTELNVSSLDEKFNKTTVTEILKWISGMDKTKIIFVGDEIHNNFFQKVFTTGALKWPININESI